MILGNQTHLFKRLAVLVGAASAGLLVSLPVFAQTKLNPNPSIFNEAPYNRQAASPANAPNGDTAKPATETQAPTAPTTTESAQPTKPITLAEVTASNSSFKTLSAAIKAAGLTETLSQNGPFTLFAPTDEAFAALPAGTVETLLKPENKATLIKILTYHVVPGAITSDQLTSGQVQTVEGESVNVQVSGTGVQVNDAKVIRPDVKASNGVIHVIDKVILPPTP